MNIEKMKSSEIHTLNRYYFYIGFLLLPFFWLVNALWIGPFAYWRMQASSERDDIMRVSGYCAIGSLIWVGLVNGWMAYFDSHSSLWDALAVRIPSI